MVVGGSLVSHAGGPGWQVIGPGRQCRPVGAAGAGGAAHPARESPSGSPKIRSPKSQFSFLTLFFFLGTYDNTSTPCGMNFKRDPDTVCILLRALLRWVT